MIFFTHKVRGRPEMSSTGRVGRFEKSGGVVEVGSFYKS